MGMFDKYNVFPTLKTKKIIIGTDSNITIRGLLSTRESKENASTWLGTSRFTQYVKVYFVAIPEKFLQRAAVLFDSDSRFVGDRTLSRFQSEYKTVSLSLDEILQNDYASSVGETDLEGGMIVNDLHFEVQLDMSENVDTRDAEGIEASHHGYWNPDTRYLRREAGFNSWYLIGFIHFDYEAFRASGIHIHDLAKLGGNCTYDKLLEKETSPWGESYMKVPDTTNAFFVAETWPEGSMHSGRNTETGADRDVPIELQVGEPYYGITHYHDGDLHENSPEDPAPDYVGWMAGHPQDPGRGPKLDVRVVPYTKVIAPGQVRAPVDHGGPGDHAGHQYNGAAQGWFFESYDQDTPNINILANQSGFFKHLTKKAEVLGDNIKKTAEDFRRQVVYKNRKSNSNILFTASASAIAADGAAFRSSDARQRVAASSCHQLIGYMSFEYLLAIYSPLGWLSEYHGQTNPAMTALFTKESEIKNLTITRRRLTNSPEGNIATSSPDFITYDNDEIPKVLITTSDWGLSGFERPEIIPKVIAGVAAIADLQVDDPGAYPGIRGFYLEDYDLFHNIAHGNYEYTVDITIVDGVKKALEDRIDAYNASRSKITEWVNIISTPVTRRSQITDETQINYPWLQGFTDPSEEIKTDEIVAGNFDYENQAYTAGAIALREDYAFRIDKFVRAFVECYSILTKVPLQVMMRHGYTSKRVDELISRRAIDPTLIWESYEEQITSVFYEAPPDLLEQYLSFMDSVAATLDRVLDRGNISKYERITSGLLTPSLDTSKENRLINIKAKVPEIVKAFGRTQIFYEPNIGWSTWNNS